MNCPACDYKLTVKHLTGITVDICEGGCGGIWFDWLELSKVDEKQEHVGEELLDTKRDENVVVDRENQRHCPRCLTPVMMRHFFSARQQVEVDECPECAGIWLDPGELASIRTRFPSEEERKRAAEEQFSDLLDKEFAEIREKRETQFEKDRAIARMFRFLCPSYYFPGK